MMLDLTGQTAVVTGASRGIGRAIALALAAAGARVQAVARGAEALEALAAEAPGIAPRAADATDPGFADALETDAIDILVNNAGINHPMPMADVPAATLDRMIDVNLRAAFRVAQAAVRSMQRHGRGGSIVHITSQMGHVGSPGRTVYCMTKHGLEGLSRAMAVELAPQGIRVNCVAPTFIETPMTEPMLADPDFRRFVLDRIPLGRVGTPEDVAAAVLYLVSPGARLVTGTSLRVDGGWTAQ